jgi:hypothetical protein
MLMGRRENMKRIELIEKLLEIVRTEPEEERIRFFALLEKVLHILQNGTPEQQARLREIIHEAHQHIVSGKGKDLV